MGVSFLSRVFCEKWGFAERDLQNGFTKRTCKTKAAFAGGLDLAFNGESYCATPAGGCGAVPVVVAAAASFRMR